MPLAPVWKHSQHYPGLLSQLLREYWQSIAIQTSTKTAFEWLLQGHNNQITDSRSVIWPRGTITRRNQVGPVISGTWSKMGRWLRLATGFHPGPLRTVQKYVRKTASFPCASLKSTFPNIKTTVPKKKQTRGKKIYHQVKGFLIILKQTLKMEFIKWITIIISSAKEVMW